MGSSGWSRPGMTGYRNQPPLYDEHWDPLWSLCEERELTLIVHAGYGPEAGAFFGEVADVYDEMQIAGGLTEELRTRFTTSAMTTKFLQQPGHPSTPVAADPGRGVRPPSEPEAPADRDQG